MGYVNILNIPKYTENRMILLFVQQREPVSQNPVPAMNGKTYESVRTGCAYGLEFWNAVGMQWEESACVHTNALQMISCQVPDCTAPGVQSGHFLENTSICLHTEPDGPAFQIAAF